MEICRLLHIKKTRTTPYHPQSDGLVERFNRTLLGMLSTCTKDNPFDWENYIRKVCMAYNSSIHASTGYSPFYLMFGIQARLPLDVMYGTIQSESTTQTFSEYASLLKKQLNTAFDLIRERVSKKHDRQKKLYNKKLHGKPYQPGDLVWLHSTVLRKGSKHKFHHPWTGPFRIVKKLSDVTYRIQHNEKKISKKWFISTT